MAPGHRRPAGGRARRRRLRPGRRVPHLGLAARPRPAQARPARLRVAALPLALQPPRPRRPRGLPAPHGGLALRPPPRPAADGEGLLDPRLRGRPRRSRSGSGSRPAARLADGSLPEPAGSLGRHRAPGRGRGMRRGHRRLRRRRRRRRGDAGRGGARRARARGRRPLQPRQLPERPARRDRRPLPRRRPDDRRRPAADPGPGREGRRRHDGDQLGHLLPRPRPGARGLARRASASPGRATSTPTTPRPRSSCG